MIQDLKKYADAFGLTILTDLQEIAERSGNDVSDLPAGLEACAGDQDADGSWFIVYAEVVNGELRRSCYESLDEDHDPCEFVPTTLAELMSLGDPREIE